MPPLMGLGSLRPTSPSRMLADLALPGDEDRIDCRVGDGAMAKVRGELMGKRSSVPPNIDDIDMPAPDRCDAKLARSRMPAKGEVIGGPRGADARWLDAAGGGGI